MGSRRGRDSGRKSAGRGEGRVVYGINPVTEALKSGPESIKKILLSSGRLDRAASEIMDRAGARGVWVERAESDELTRLAGSPAHQGVVAMIAGPYSYADLDDIVSAWKDSGAPAFILLLDSIQDPQNLGSLIRTANAAGVHGVVIPRDRAAEVTPAVVKASAGATEHTLVARETNLKSAIERLKEEGVWVAGVEAGAKEAIYSLDLKGDIAIVIGSEGKGIRRLVMEACDFQASIPMAGKINSLNAAQAGAVAMFEVRRQRDTRGTG